MYINHTSEWEEKMLIDAEEINIELNKDNEKNKLFNKYLELLYYYNEILNLTSIKQEEAYEKNIIDSITGIKYLNLIFEDKLKSLEIADIGTGGGIPGIVYSIYNPFLKIYLIESNKKKALFLKRVKEQLGLSFEIINKNVHEIYDKKFDICISRGFGSIYKLIKVSKNIFKNKTFLLFYKGKIEKIQKELKEIESKYSYFKNIKKVEIVKILNFKYERNLVGLLWEK